MTDELQAIFKEYEKHARTYGDDANGIQMYDAISLTALNIIETCIDRGILAPGPKWSGDSPG